MEPSPLHSEIVFQLGPVPISRAVMTTWLIMALLAGLCWLGTRRTRLSPGRWQAALEIVVETIAHQIAEVMRRDPAPFVPLLGTLFLFLVFANLTAVVPGLAPPTGHIETPAALALLVFFSAHVLGIRQRGLVSYLKGYVRPNPLLLPLNVLAEFTRTFSLMIRLFGNIMSHEIVIGIAVVLAGLFVPVPFMALGILIGLVQAYIFTILATVFIGAAVSGAE